jgi:hypothetical protein
MSTLRDIQAGVPHGSVLAPTLYSLYTNNSPQTPRICQPSADDICTTDSEEIYVLRKLQRGLTSVESWFEPWNMKLNEGKTFTIYFFHCRRPVEARRTLKGWSIPLVNNVKYLGVIFDN